LTIFNVFSGSAFIGSNAVAIMNGYHCHISIHPRLIHTKDNSVSCHFYNLDSVLRKHHLHPNGSIKFWSDLFEALWWCSFGFSYRDGLTRIVTGQFEIECNNTDGVVIRSLASLALLLLEFGSSKIHIDTDVSVAIVTHGSIICGIVNHWIKVLVTFR
jgi:hypothetical protein